jgi:abelson tyrosine-protein kinase 1
MAYLHEQDVLHGDLKVRIPIVKPDSVAKSMIPAQAANILVDDDTSCVISDFGQSEMKSEVYRLTRASEPRTLVSSSDT